MDQVHYLPAMRSMIGAEGALMLCHFHLCHSASLLIEVSRNPIIDDYMVKFGDSSRRQSPAEALTMITNTTQHLKQFQSNC